MKLISKTQTELNIEEIEKSAEMFANAINTAIVTLNLSYEKLWNLPDDQLESVLNTLAQNNKLQSLFENHNFAANSLNSIAEKVGSVPTNAINFLGRELKFDDNGIISIVKNVDNNS
jgi:hypothetical protein